MNNPFATQETKPSIVAGVANKSSELVGGLAAVVASIPGSAARGAKRGWENASEDNRTIERYDAIEDFVKLGDNFLPAKAEAIRIKEEISKAKIRKDRIRNDVDASEEEVEEAKAAYMRTERKLKAEYQKRFGVTYEEWAKRASLFKDDADLASTAIELAHYKGKDLADRRDLLERQYREANDKLAHEEAEFAQTCKRFGLTEVGTK